MNESRDSYIEFNVVIGSRPTCGKKGFRATELFSSTCFKGFHSLIIPDFRSKMSVVNDSISFRNASGHISGKGLISNSWFSKSIELINMAEKSMNVQSSNSG